MIAAIGGGFGLIIAAFGTLIYFRWNSKRRMKLKDVKTGSNSSNFVLMMDQMTFENTKNSSLTNNRSSVSSRKSFINNNNNYKNNDNNNEKNSKETEDLMPLSKTKKYSLLIICISLCFLFNHLLNNRNRFNPIEKAAREAALKKEIERNRVKVIIT